MIIYKSFYVSTSKTAERMWELAEANEIATVYDITESNTDMFRVTVYGATDAEVEALADYFKN